MKHIMTIRMEDRPDVCTGKEVRLIIPVGESHILEYNFTHEGLIVDLRLNTDISNNLRTHCSTYTEIVEDMIGTDN